MTFLVLTPSAGVADGAGQRQSSRQVIYAVLTKSSRTAQVEVLALDKVLALEASSDLSVEDSTQVPAPETIKRDAQIVTEPVLAEPTVTSEVPVPGLPPAPGYLFGTGLHRQPRLLNEITVNYPSAAGVREGRVTLRILVSETGAIDNLAVFRADPKGFFEDAALEAFARAEFAPGVFLGIPVKSQFFVEVDFLPINRGRASGRGY